MAELKIPGVRWYLEHLSYPSLSFIFYFLFTLLFSFLYFSDFFFVGFIYLVRVFIVLIKTFSPPFLTNLPIMNNPARGQAGP